MSQPLNIYPVLIHVDPAVGRAFAWISIGLAVSTSFLQGLVTAIASMTESSNRWTFRFRLALVEHWWWTLVSVFLLASLVMNALSYMSGNGGEPISVLALSTATFLALVRYTVPAWQERHYIKTRWLAWTGDSRTAIPNEHLRFCGSEGDWCKLVDQCRQALKDLRPTPSDAYGWRMWPVGGIPYDPTDILNAVSASHNITVDSEKAISPSGTYTNVDPAATRVSLRWGRQQHFRRRVSRAVTSMPLGLLKSYPITVDGYDGKGLATAMGILGRNKGLAPGTLVFKIAGISAHLENFSTWRPRPAKVLRSFYDKVLSAQYGGLGPDYVAAAVELALLMADIPYWAIQRWLECGLEQQCLRTDRALAHEYLEGVPDQERRQAIDAHYRSSYVSMIVSLNHMDVRLQSQHATAYVLDRPDLLCLGLLLKAQDLAEPSWWNRAAVQTARKKQLEFLAGSDGWRLAVAKLCGLQSWPQDFDATPSVWGSSAAAAAAAA